MAGTAGTVPEKDSHTNTVDSELNLNDKFDKTKNIRVDAAITALSLKMNYHPLADHLHSETGFLQGSLYLAAIICPSFVLILANLCSEKVSHSMIPCFTVGQGCQTDS